MSGWALSSHRYRSQTQVPVAVRERAQGVDSESGIPASWNGTPNGRETARARWEDIKSLDHYDPDYPYDSRHVYGPDWTDDDAYGKDGVTFMAPPSHRNSINSCFDEAQRSQEGPGHVFSDRCLRLPDLGVSTTNRYARSGQVLPDVFIQARPRPDDNRHEIAYDPDNPILFVLEVLSESTLHHDLGPKVEIYRAMGVREYWFYDPERLHRREDEPRLWGLRLAADGDYVDIEPVRMADGVPVYRSDVLGEFRMLHEGGDVHTLQTWDRERLVWLDPVRARDLEAEETKRLAVQDAMRTAEETKQLAVQDAMRTAEETKRLAVQNAARDATCAAFVSQLKLQVAQERLEPHVPETLAAAWERTRWVPDPADVLNVLIGTSDWSVLMPPRDG